MVIKKGKSRINPIIEISCQKKKMAYKRDLLSHLPVCFQRTSFANRRALQTCGWKGQLTDTSTAERYDKKGRSKQVSTRPKVQTVVKTNWTQTTSSVSSQAIGWTRLHLCADLYYFQSIERNENVVLKQDANSHAKIEADKDRNLLCLQRTDCRSYFHVTSCTRSIVRAFVNKWDLCNLPPKFSRFL